MSIQARRDLAFATFDKAKKETPQKISRRVCLQALFVEAAKAQMEMSVMLASALFDEWCIRNGKTVWPNTSNW
jgi:hypothetical protein